MRGIILYLAILILVGCETERILFEGPFHVRFTTIARTEKESKSDVIKIEVHNAGPVLSEDVAVSYQISGDAREGIDYSIVGSRGLVTIPAGEFFGYIEVKLINNANNILRSQDIIFTLTRTNSTSLEVGQGEGGIGKTFTFTILDDCILGGNYMGVRSSSTISDVQITSSDCETYRISNWDVDIFGAADPVPLNFVDNGDNTLEVKSQKVEANYGFYSQEFTVQGIGTVNPTTREIFLTLEFTDGTNTYNVTVSFKPV